MLRNKQKLMLLTLSWALASCTAIPPDFMACANLGAEGYCRTYVSKKKTIIDSDKNLYVSSSGKKMRWDDVAAASILIPADQFVSLKNWFDNYCHQNQCPDGLGDWGSFATDLQNHLKQGK